jgi:superfamily II DNA or RNA helicase
MLDLTGLRVHQKAAVRRGEALGRAQALNSDTLLHVIPGGGKSRCVPLMHHYGNMRGGVIWVAPRLSLQAQGAEAAAEGIDGRGHGALNLAPDIRSYSKDVHDGLVTNYANLVCNLRSHLAALDGMGKGSLIVADEVHHCAGSYGDELPGWTAAFDALVHKHSKRHLLLMSGTPYRGDGKIVYGFGYGDDGKIVAPHNAIRYDRTTAINDGAITPVKVQYLDGPVTFSLGNGKDKEPDDFSIDSFRDLDHLKVSSLKKQRMWSASKRAFLSWLNLDTVHKPAILGALKDLRDKQRRFPGAQMIVTLDSQGKAQHLRDWLRYKHNVKAALAVSDYGFSLDELNGFRAGETEVLFTVGMAYEGLDAPRVTHLLHLGACREPSWLTQFFARAWRWGPRDWPDTGRYAYLYAPMDPLMKNSIEQIRRDLNRPVSIESPPGDAFGGGVDKDTGLARLERIIDGGVL